MVTKGLSRSPRPVSFSLEPSDRHRMFTVMAFGAGVIAASMGVFGLPPVDLHGPLHKFGIMDPLCGGTRAAYFTATGDLATAWKYNPLGILVVAGVGAAVLRAAVGLASRRWLTVAVHPTPAVRRVIIFVIGAALVVLEIRQQLRADLLMSGTFTL